MAFARRQGQYRLNALSDPGFETLASLTQNLPYEEGLGYIEKTGKLPPSILERLSSSPADLADVQRYIGQLPNRTTAIQNYINGLPKQDIFSLSKSELENRINAYNELASSAQEKQYRTVPDLEKLSNAISSKFNNAYFKARGIYGVSDDVARKASSIIASRLASNNYDPQFVADYIKDQSGQIGHGDFERLKKIAANDIPQAFNERVGRGEFVKQEEVPLNVNVPQDLGDLQTALSRINAKEASESAIQDFLRGLPAQQEKNVNDLEAALQRSQGSFFSEQLAPSIAQNLNARGIINSGDLAASLALAGKGLQRDITNITAPIRSENFNRTQGLIYENALRSALESGRNLDEAVNFARQLYARNSQNQFEAGQSELDRNFKEKLFNEGNALTLALNQPKSGPTGLDYFLQYGLPTLTRLGSAYISSGGLKKSPKYNPTNNTFNPAPSNYNSYSSNV